MASVISASTTSATALNLSGDTSGVLQIATGATPTTAITVDASQNVGIGTASPDTKLQVSGTSGSAQFKAGTDINGYFEINAYDSSPVYCVVAGTNATAGVFGTQTNIPTIFFTNNTERMRIDTSGNVLIGTTSSSGTAGALQYMKKSTGTIWQVGPATIGSGNTFYVLNAGDAGVALDSGSTSWRSNSDERLKTDLKPIENAIDKINSLRSVTGRFKTDEETVSRSFLIAQDVQAVLPEAVNVQDDELGTLGIRYTEVMPLLVAAIKELKAIVDTQAERIAALEGK